MKLHNVSITRQPLRKKSFLSLILAGGGSNGNASFHLKKYPTTVGSIGTVIQYKVWE